MSAICTVSKNTDIQLHPAARFAYEWSQLYPRLISHGRAPNEPMTILSRTALHCVIQAGNEDSRSKSRTFLFYSPIWAALCWPSGHPPVGSRLIYETSNAVPTEKQIEIEAWCSALQPLLLSVQTSQIALLRDSLQSMMPQSVSKLLFDKSKISDTDICHWTGLARGTLIQQRARLANTLNQEPFDPVSFLSANWNL